MTISQVFYNGSHLLIPKDEKFILTLKPGTVTNLKNINVLGTLIINSEDSTSKSRFPILNVQNITVHGSISTSHVKVQYQEILDNHKTFI